MSLEDISPDDSVANLRLHVKEFVILHIRALWTCEQSPPGGGEPIRTMGARSSNTTCSGDAPSPADLLNYETFAIASFGSALQPPQSILYTILKCLAAKFFEHPTPPSWRESEVSTELHATGGGVNRCAGGGLMVDGAQWERNFKLDCDKLYHIGYFVTLPVTAMW